MRYVPVKNVGVALVDDEDYSRVAARHWYAVRRSGIIYAESAAKPAIMMHRLIVGDKACGAVVDHINGNPLDNRRCNLRICKQGQNARNCRIGKNNRSGFKGVSLRDGRWRARIMVNGQDINLGRFDRIEDAAKAYDAAALRYFGEFAYLNFGPVPQPTTEGAAA